MKIPDTTFRQFTKVVDDFEGDRIRRVANSAASILQLFMDDGVITSRLWIEDIAEEVLELLPRSSPDIRSLFATISASA